MRGGAYWDMRPTEGSMEIAAAEQVNAEKAWLYLAFSRLTSSETKMKPTKTGKGSATEEGVDEEVSAKPVVLFIFGKC
ncbi:unnamed protein product [Caenorhabditis auriculariae]|uniref:Uncharacterized protein n=1 Tax=Caenorhabditis auriculariae TaxID=2777116 RepID=A0A8S1HZ24_9PELO|nr:unnamed protein product [Caenorhabditis auriculariae]